MSSFFSPESFTEQDISLAQSNARSLNELNERKSEAELFRTQQAAAFPAALSAAALPSPPPAATKSSAAAVKTRPKAALPSCIQKRPSQDPGAGTGSSSSSSGSGGLDGAACGAKRTKTEVDAPKVSLVAYGDDDDEDDDDDESDEAGDGAAGDGGAGDATKSTA